MEDSLHKTIRNGAIKKIYQNLLNTLFGCVERNFFCVKVKEREN